MKKFNRVALTVLLSTTAAAAFANQGFYFGFGAVQNSVRAKPTGGTTPDPEENWYGIAGTGFVGYNFGLSRNFDLGLQLGGRYGNTSGTRDTTAPKGFTPTQQLSYDLNNPWSVDLTVVPSYQYSKRMNVYLRAGAAFANFNKTGSTAAGVPANYSKDELGYMGGLGVEMALNWHWALRAEYDYTYYKSFTSNSIKIQPTEQAFMVGLTYYLDSRQPPQNTYVPDVLPNEQLYYTPAAPDKPSLNYNAIYVGFNGYVSSMNAWKQQTLTVSPHSASTFLNRQYDANLYLGGPGFGGYVGGSRQFGNRLYLGLEGQFGYAKIKQTTTAVDTASASAPYQSWSLQRGYTFGASILPGYIVDPRSLFYGRAGLVWTQFKRTGDYHSSTNFTKLDLGFRLGAGYEFALTNYMSLRAEYDYTFYRTMKTYYSNGVINSGDPKNPSITSSTSITPSDNQFKVGLNFRF